MNFVLPLAGLTGTGIILSLWAVKHRGDIACRSQTATSQVIAFASAWLVLPLLSVLNLSLLPEGEIAHDRHLYLPSVGVAILGSLALRQMRLGSAKLWGQPAIQVVLGSALTLLFAFGVVFQSLIWADDLVLYYRAVTVLPENNNLRADFAASVAARKGLYDAAIKLYEQVLAHNPNHPTANHNLGLLYYRIGRLDEAERYLRRALLLGSSKPDSLLYLGLIELKRGHLEQAGALTHQAVILDPEGYGNHFARGMVLKITGDLVGALREFKEELALNPNQQEARRQISEIQNRSGASQSGSASSPKIDDRHSEH